MKIIIRNMDNLQEYETDKEKIRATVKKIAVLS